MDEMLDNRSFDSGGQDVSSGEENTQAPVESSEETVTESSESPVTQETNTDVQTEIVVDEEKQDIEAMPATNNNGVEETTETAVNAVEKTEGSTPEGETAEATMSTKANKRFQKLLADKRQLSDRVNELTRSQKENGIAPNADGEIEMTPEQLNSFISNQVQSTLTAEREQQFVQQRAEVWDDDIQELMTSNPELDPESEKFNKSLSDGLIDLIKATNTDDSGNPTVNRLPSEVYATINQTISAAKSAGKKEAKVGLKKQAESTAVQSTASADNNEQAYSDEQLVDMQKNDPQKYAGLIEDNII